MKSKIKFISQKRLKIHEFETTFRYLNKSEQEWGRKSEILSEIQADAIKNFIKSLAPLFLGYLVLTSLKIDNEIALTISNFKVSVPIAYYLFGLSFLYMITMIFFNHLSVAFSLKASMATKIMLSGFSSTVYDLLKKKDDVALGLPIVMNPFIKEVLPIMAIMTYILLLAYSALLLPLGAFGYLLMIELINLLLTSNASFLETVLVLICIGITAYSALFVILFHLPLPMRKNKAGVRWSFLYPTMPIHSSDKEKFERWSKDSSK